jgi:serine/threonine protein kinase/tetratricopeptide (TPR) repeat protein
VENLETSENGSGTDAAPGSLSELLRQMAAGQRGQQLARWKDQFRVGEVVAGRFELKERIGHGGFGRVFRAEDRVLKRPVALKAIPPGGQSDDSIAREAEIAAQFQHENVVRLHDYGRCEGGAYLILELIGGETLARRLRRGPLPRTEAVRIALDVTRALVYAHSQNVLHRDLKPENVLLPEKGVAKVTDFGLAYYFRASTASEEAAVAPDDARGGTRGYISPEQARGGPEDARTDIFAVGVLLRVMISGDDPGAAPGLRLRREQNTELGRLIARASDPDPMRRPRSAEQLARELEALHRRLQVSHRTRRGWAFVAALAASLIGAAGLLGESRHSPAVVPVAVADLDNAAEDPRLDVFSDLLRAALERREERVWVLPRERLRALATEAATERGHVDCTVALLAGSKQSRDSVVLCAEARRNTDGVEVQLQARSVSGGELFALEEAVPGGADLHGLVDRLAAGIVNGLGAGSSGLQAPRHEVQPPHAPDMQATLHYLLGKQCADRPVRGQNCSQELRAALKADPNFPEAAHELAMWFTRNGAPREQQLQWAHRAETLADRAPPHTQALIHAWAAHLEGKDVTALQLLAEVSRTWPEDREAPYQAGDILRSRDELSTSVRWYEQALRIDPDFARASGDLALVLGALRRTDDLQRWVTRWQTLPGVGHLHGLSIARGWLGDMRGATDAAERALAFGAHDSGQEDLLEAKLFAGDYRAVETAARGLTTSGGQLRRFAYQTLAAAEMYQGRPRSALARLDELGRELPEVQNDALYRAARADYQVGLGDAAAAWAEVEAARRLDSQLAAGHAVSLAYLGDLEHAAVLARDLGEGTALQRTYAAVVRLRQGDVQGGLAELRKAATVAPVLSWQVSPLFLYGELLAAAGRDREAVEVLRQADALYLPGAVWRSWAHPRSLYLLARSYHRLGREDDARTTIERLLREWYHAEPGAPFIREARQLAAHLPPE